jgi:MerR family transcriptional regulator/heat shock protein HspR
MMMDWETKSRYVISIAARLVGIEAHTLRYYEKLGLIQPERSSGNIRLYSEDDINRLRHIKTLMNDLGVNLAGVEVTLRLMQRMEEMQQRVEEMENKIKGLMETEVEDIEWKEE